jgi:hypothetical protein
MKSAVLVGMTLFILPLQASALTGVERGLTGVFYSATSVAKHEESVCLPMISEPVRRYFRANPERLHREAGILAIFAIVRNFRCP